MAITILPPPPPPQDFDYDSDTSSDSEGGGVDIDGDLEMRPQKRTKISGSHSIVTPGEIVTDDPQWMRFVHPLHFPPACSNICGAGCTNISIVATAHISPPPQRPSTPPSPAPSRKPTNSSPSLPCAPATRPKSATWSSVASPKCSRKGGASISAHRFSPFSHYPLSTCRVEY